MGTFLTEFDLVEEGKKKMAFSVLMLSSSVGSYRYILI